MLAGVRKQDLLGATGRMRAMSLLDSLTAVMWLVLIASIAVFALAVWRRSRAEQTVEHLIKRTSEAAKAAEAELRRKADILRGKPVAETGGDRDKRGAPPKDESKGFTDPEFDLAQLKDRLASAETRTRIWGIVRNVATVLGILSSAVQIGQFVWKFFA